MTGFWLGLFLACRQLAAFLLCPHRAERGARDGEHSGPIRLGSHCAVSLNLNYLLELPWRLSGKGLAYQHRRRGFNPWVGNIPWRRKWQPTPVFLPGESPWTDKPGRLQPVGSQSVRHDLVSEQQDSVSKYRHNWG